jgi:hypothetical protein
MDHICTGGIVPPLCEVGGLENVGAKGGDQVLRIPQTIAPDCYSPQIMLTCLVLLGEMFTCLLVLIMASNPPIIYVRAL